MEIFICFELWKWFFAGDNVQRDFILSCDFLDLCFLGWTLLENAVVGAFLAFLAKCVCTFAHLPRINWETFLFSTNRWGVIKSGARTKRKAKAKVGCRGGSASSNEPDEASLLSYTGEARAHGFCVIGGHGNAKAFDAFRVASEARMLLRPRH